MPAEKAPRTPRKSAPKKAALTARAKCLCGDVVIEIGVPARWAWHDHSRASRIAHGAAYATYVGAYRSRCRIVKGGDKVSVYEEPDTQRTRTFCTRCGTPLIYERPRAPQMLNIPRALFAERTGREPRYHIGIDELQEWTYLGARLTPLKGFPGVVWDGARRKKPSGP